MLWGMLEMLSLKSETFGLFYCVFLDYHYYHPNVLLFECFG